jgi:two-component system, response regulator PdtaR
MHALIIEHDAITAMMIEDELRDLGFSSVAIASTEGQAIAAVAEHCPDLVTSVGCLRVGSGIGAVRTIRGSCPVPVIFITVDPDHARHQVPDTSVLEKPFTIAQLAASVRLVRPSIR